MSRDNVKLDKLDCDLVSASMGFLSGVQHQLDAVEDKYEGTSVGHDLMQALIHIEDAFLRLNNALQNNQKSP